jgi:hypothetical protein
VIFPDLSIPIDPDLTVHSVSSMGGRVHFGGADKGEDVVSLYGTPKEEIPPTSAGRSENGSFNFAAANGNQVIDITLEREKHSSHFFIKIREKTI